MGSRIEVTRTERFSNATTNRLRTSVSTVSDTTTDAINIDIDRISINITNGSVYMTCYRGTDAKMVESENGYQLSFLMGEARVTFYVSK